MLGVMPYGKNGSPLQGRQHPHAELAHAALAEAFLLLLLLLLLLLREIRSSASHGERPEVWHRPALREAGGAHAAGGISRVVRILDLRCGRRHHLRRAAVVSVHRLYSCA
jgi:hypothetical protein